MVNHFYIFVAMLLCCYGVFQFFLRKFSLLWLLFNLGGAGDSNRENNVRNLELY